MDRLFLLLPKELHRGKTCLWNAKTIEKVHEGSRPNLFDYLADVDFQLILLPKELLDIPYLWPIL